MAGQVRDAFSRRTLCVVAGNAICDGVDGPLVGTICGRRVRRAGGSVVATVRGRYLRAGDGGHVLATVFDNEIHDGVDGPLLATFTGGWRVGVGGASFLTAL